MVTLAQSRLTTTCDFCGTASSRSPHQAGRPGRVAALLWLLLQVPSCTCLQGSLKRGEDAAIYATVMCGLHSITEGFASHFETLP